jgi:TonB family protein
MKSRNKLIITLVLIGFFGTSLFAVEFNKQTAEQPIVVAAVPPVYPPMPLQAHAGGEVIVEVKIDSAGDVSSARAEKGHPLLQDSCVFAARRWKFAPAKDAPVERTARLTFVFVPPDKELPKKESAVVFYPPYKVQVTGRFGRIDY